jgi:hypothetical protein
MIKWNCAFNMPDSAVQLAVAHVTVTDYKNINNRSLVNVKITDETGELSVKDYTEEFARTFGNVDEIYEELQPLFTDSVISGQVQ